MPANKRRRQLPFGFNSLSKYYEYGIIHRSWWIIALVLAVCGLSGQFAIANLGFNTDTTEMLSPELPFHQNRIRFWRTFPQDVKSILVVVDAPTPESAKTAAVRLETQLEAEIKIIESVYIPGKGAFFDEQGLLYLDLNQLDTLSDTLSNTQPFLAKLAENYSLEGLLKPIGTVIGEKNSEVKIDLNPILDTIHQAFRNAEAGNLRPVSWQNLMTGENSSFNMKRRFLIVKARLDYNRLFPAQQALELIRRLSRSYESETPGLRIRMTGETALQHEELESVSQGSAISAIVSLVLVCITLFWGLRSLKLMFATFLTLIAGLFLTAGFATLAVGHLNMISIAFAVLYIGLGVDYAIHLCLHYRDFLNRGWRRPEALVAGIKTVGPALTLCAITSAVGFYAYIPTSYSGVSELGIIAGTSMFIGLLLTFTFLPALLNNFEVSPSWAIGSSKDNSFTVKPSRHDRLIRWSAVILAVLSAFALPRVTFDFDPVHLRNANSESVQTYNDLVRDPNTSPMTLTLLESNLEKTRQFAQQIEKLPTVDKVITIEQFVPKDQEVKLERIEQMSYLLGPLPNGFPEPNNNGNQQQAYENFKNAVIRALEIHRGTELESRLTVLRDQFENFDRSSDSPDRKIEKLAIFERNLLNDLPATVSVLKNAMKASPFGFQEVPAELRDRWLSPDGSYRIQIFPKQDITQLHHLRRFVEEVQALAPNVTDLPVIYLEAGNEVVKAFKQALLTALIAIIIVLLIVLRSLRDTVLVLIPLILAAMLTCAASVMLRLPFNFANIIAVPLLFGLGVDNGIHIMHSLRNGTYVSNHLMANVTSRGIFFSALTTIFSFSSLAFSTHNGTASMGILLAIGIFFMLICTLIVLPAFARPLFRESSNGRSAPIDQI